MQQGQEQTRTTKDLTSPMLDAKHDGWKRSDGSVMKIEMANGHMRFCLCLAIDEMTAVVEEGERGETRRRIGVRRSQKRANWCF